MQEIFSRFKLGWKKTQDANLKDCIQRSSSNEQLRHLFPEIGLVQRADYLTLSNNKNCGTYIKRKNGIRSAWMSELAPKIWSKGVPSKLLAFGSTS